MPGSDLLASIDSELYCRRNQESDFTVWRNRSVLRVEERPVAACRVSESMKPDKSKSNYAISRTDQETVVRTSQHLQFIEQGVLHD